MRYVHAGIAAAVCVVAVFAVGGCSQPKSGTYFEPEITASHDGIFSSDVTFWLNSVNRIDWSRGDDDTVTSSKTPVGTVCQDALVPTVRGTRAIVELPESTPVTVWR